MRTRRPTLRQRTCPGCGRLVIRNHTCLHIAPRTTPLDREQFERIRAEAAAEQRAAEAAAAQTVMEFE